MIVIKNFERHQAFKDGRPIHWIKLWCDLLNNREWRRLSGPAAKLLIDLWILAADRRHLGEIHDSLDDIAYDTRSDVATVQQLTQELVAQGFIEIVEDRTGSYETVRDRALRVRVREEKETEVERETGPRVDALHPVARSIVEKWDRRVWAILDTRFITAGMPDPSVKGLSEERRVELVGEALVEYGDRDFDARLFAGFVKRLRNAPRQGTEADAVRIAGEKVTPATWTPVVRERDSQPERLAIDVDTLTGGA